MKWRWRIGKKWRRNATFLRRPEVPGFWPSKGVVSTRETLKSTMDGYLKKGKGNREG